MTKKILDLAGLQRYDNKLKDYVNEEISKCGLDPIPSADVESLFESPAEWTDVEINGTVYKVTSDERVIAEYDRITDGITSIRDITIPADSVFVTKYDMPLDYFGVTLPDTFTLNFLGSEIKPNGTCLYNKTSLTIYRHKTTTGDYSVLNNKIALSDK